MLKYPLKHISITNDYSNTHTAIDLGWAISPNDPIYACGDGTVTNIYYINDGGNTLTIKYDNNYSSEFMHIRDNTITVKVGDRVNSNTKVAEIGNTGTKTTGPHLHLIMRNENNERVDPKICLYVYPDQTYSKSIENKLLFYNQVYSIVTPIKKDPLIDQIEVIIDNLHVRTRPSLNGTVLGYATKGIYNYTNKIDVDNYTWYEIEKDKWIASSSEWVIIHDKILQPIAKKFMYTCTKTDIYAIKLNNGEKLYIE